MLLQLRCRGRRGDERSAGVLLQTRRTEVWILRGKKKERRRVEFAPPRSSSW